VIRPGGAQRRVQGRDAEAARGRGTFSSSSPTTFSWRPTSPWSAS